MAQIPRTSIAVLKPTLDMVERAQNLMERKTGIRPTKHQLIKMLVMRFLKTNK
tara:strand:- start:649 stop:807 length:159 start_codon:yes stop_codon:yes gene_type:complete